MLCWFLAYNNAISHNNTYITSLPSPRASLPPQVVIERQAEHPVLWSNRYQVSILHLVLGFPGASAGNQSAHSAGDLGLIPGLGRSLRKANSYLLQYSGLENSMDCIVDGVAKSWTRLSDFHFQCICGDLLSPFVPLSPSPTVSTNSFSTSESVFLPCK